MGPDLTGANEDAAWLFDTMHLKKTNQFVASWLADSWFSETGGDQLTRISLAFAFGFLAHMAADIIIHPYVDTFAGTYDDQSIEVALKDVVPQQTAQMHRLTEVTQDSYVAHTHFGYERLSDAGRFGDPRPSWGSFWRDILLRVNQGGIYELKYDSVCHEYCKIAKKTYATPTDKQEVSAAMLKGAISNHYSALTLAYDGALDPVPDRFDMTLVNHPYQDRVYEHYVDAAVRLTQHFWGAAISFLESDRKEQARRDFFSEVRNFSLDTGFTIRVDSEPTGIVIRHEHSWALFP
jgi:hypothetical protein